MCIYIYEYISILILSTCIFLYMHNMYVHVTVITAIRIFRVPQRFSLDLTQSPSYGASPGITHKEKRCQRNKKKWRGIIFFECLDWRGHFEDHVSCINYKCSISMMCTEWAFNIKKNKTQNAKPHICLQRFWEEDSPHGFGGWSQFELRPKFESDVRLCRWRPKDIKVLCSFLVDMLKELFGKFPDFGQVRFL